MCHGNPGIVMISLSGSIFKKNSTADCLNKWRSSDPEPQQTDRNVQKALNQIGYGKMIILMPKSKIFRNTDSNDVSARVSADLTEMGIDFESVAPYLMDLKVKKK